MSDKLYGPVHPGEVLREDFLKPLGISAYRLAKATGLPQTRIGQILAGKRSITPQTALRLSRALGLSDRYWINAQARYDIEVERELHGAELGQVEVLVAG
ncbi:MAG: HigA family addiction module antidote protein [Bifidobacteriaceae bacterium]|jgi:addiction module HigA family antidote|nr:HigA family addiction module antidote protein [Bifidobacteriaceae bacterium]